MSAGFGEQINILILPGIEPMFFDRPICSLVATPTEFLFRRFFVFLVYRTVFISKKIFLHFVIFSRDERNIISIFFFFFLRERGETNYNLFVTAREIYSQLLCVWQAECNENQKPRSETDLTETIFLVQYVSG
jgi:hypothetical protein